MKALGDQIGGYLVHVKKVERRNLERIKLAWKEVMRGPLVHHLRPVVYRYGVLTIEVSRVYGVETLRTQKGLLRKRLHEVFPDIPIRHMEFRPQQEPERGRLSLVKESGIDAMDSRKEGTRDDGTSPLKRLSDAMERQIEDLLSGIDDLRIRRHFAVCYRRHLEHQAAEKNGKEARS